MQQRREGKGVNLQLKVGLDGKFSCEIGPPGEKRTQQEVERILQSEAGHVNEKNKMSEGSKLSSPLPVSRERGRFTGVEKEKPLTKVVWPKEFWEAETIV